MKEIKKIIRTLTKKEIKENNNKNNNTIYQKIIIKK